MWFLNLHRIKNYSISISTCILFKFILFIRIHIVQLCCKNMKKLFIIFHLIYFYYIGKINFFSFIVDYHYKYARIVLFSVPGLKDYTRNTTIIKYSLFPYLCKLNGRIISRKVLLNYKTIVNISKNHVR